MARDARKSEEGARTRGERGRRGAWGGGGWQGTGQAAQQPGAEQGEGRKKRDTPERKKDGTDKGGQSAI